MSVPAVDELRFVAVGQHDPLAEPLIDELALEYADRYGGTGRSGLAWLRTYPAEEFAPPGGGLLIGLHDGPTGHRRSIPPIRRRHRRAQTDLDRQPPPPAGYAKALLVELEAEIAARGYRGST